MSHIDADRTLRDLLRSDGRLSFEHAARLLTDLARSLEPLHSTGQGHGAITPQSVYLDATGKAYLADFGLALRDEDFGRGPGSAAFAGSMTTRCVKRLARPPPRAGCLSPIPPGLATPRHRAR